VTVLEKQDRIGGKIWLAVRIPKNDIQRKWIDYYEGEIERLAIDVGLNQEVTVADVEAMNPDVVLVATGGRPLVPEGVAGTDLPGVVTADDVLWDTVEVGESVAMIGGSSMGLETADYIFTKDKERRITVVEMLPTVLSDISHDAELALLDKLVDKDIRFLTETKLEGIVADGGRLSLDVLRYGMPQRLTGFDTVVVAVGVQSDDTLGAKLMETREHVHRIGDAEGPGDYRKAIHDAADVALRI
jgi:pyruvate/2-oxoglutarate dehydrogenase complex dihydrolipoamide dehydrogenase (E3) component